jgi:anhydro-N-acetylmuramic acid kinase
MGLMSGTSLDGVDAVLVDFQGSPQSLGHAFTPFEPAFKEELLRLNSPGPNELHRAALASNTLASLYAQTCNGLLKRLGLPADRIQALGAHGQTIRHQPQLHDAWGYSTQLLSGPLLAELTHIDVIHDFRSRDLAAGGQGAPLVPAFHQHFFASERAYRIILNIGGMANVSILAPTSPSSPSQARDNERLSFSCSGFDCGPGNVLMDAWCLRHTGQAYDAHGQWAQTGRTQEALLSSFLSEPFFKLPPPKSTGRDLFNETWLDAHLSGPFAQLPKEDVQATLCALSAQSILSSVDAFFQDAPHLHQQDPSIEMVVCGGGAYNLALVQDIRARAHLFASLRDMKLLNSDVLGVAPEQVESFAFAWLARQRVLGLSANLPQVTGAKGPRILGSWIKA